MKRFFSALLVASLVIGAMLLVSCLNDDPGESPHNQHDFRTTVVEPTCIKGGYTEYQCDCGYVMRDTFTNPSNEGHNFVYSGEKVEPTCASEGYDIYVCSICGEETHENIVKGNHSWGEWVVVQEPACTGDMGIERRECEVCGTHEEKFTSSDHRYGEPETIEATCTEPEMIKYTCTICGEEKLEKGKVKALGHDFGEWYVVSDSTCDTVGELRRDCQRDGCGYHESKEISRHHYTVEVNVDPTCDTHGYVGHQCEDCGKLAIDHYIDPLGHTFTEWHVVEGNPNLEQRECETCGKVEYRTKE